MSKQLQQSRRNKKFLLACFALIFSGVFFSSCKKNEPVAEAEPNIVVSVRVAQAERKNIAAQVSALGSINPIQQATVSAKISAPIAQMAILKNKIVRAGEVIAILESRDLQAQKEEALALLDEAKLSARALKTGTIPQASAQTEKDLREAKANVENARITYERRAALFKQDGISARDVEAAKLALTTAEGQLALVERTSALRTSAINPNDAAVAEIKIKEAEQRIVSLDTQLSYAVVRAPVSGIITEQFQFKGEYAAAGAKLITISDLSEIIVKAPFADTVAAQIKIGEVAHIKPADAPDQELAGRVSLISRSSDAANRTVEVWVNMKNPGGRLRSGGSAEVTFATQHIKDAVVIPVSAVTLDASNADKGTVMVVDKASIAHETKVTVGIRTGELIQITEGLNGEETVVIEGGYALPDKTKVQVSEEKEEEEKGEKKDEKEGEKP
jgi:HlyD family secretion protein